MKKAGHVRSEYREFRREYEVGDFSDVPSMTDTSFADQCDVNNIVAKFLKTGQITHLAKRQGFYADVSSVPDLLGAMQVIHRAKDTFEKLPAKVRERFGGSYEALVAFATDPKNHDELAELGLIPKPESPSPSPSPSSSSSPNQPLPKSGKKAQPSNDDLNNDKA